MKKLLLSLVALLATLGAWAQTVEIVVSTSTSAPEHQYEIKSANNLWMTAYTSPSNTMPGRFAFFGGTDAAYKIYSVDKKQWVSYTQSDSYNAGTGKATFVDSQEDAMSWNVTKEGDYYQFAPYKTDGTVASIYWNWHGGVSSNPVNNTSVTIGFYTKGAIAGNAGDNGSRWTLSNAVSADEEAYLAAKGLLGTGIGYPNTTSEAYAALNALTENSTAKAVELAKNAYLNCTDIEMPVDGGVYQFTFVDNKGSKEFKMSANGNTLSANGGTSSNFYCRKYTNVNDEVRYAFISMDGKFLAYNTLTDNYIIHKSGEVTTERLLNDFAIEAMALKSNTYITSVQEQRVGLLCATCPDRGENNTDNGCLIVKISDGTFNNSSAPYDNGSYTSAIKMVAVQDAEITDAVRISSSTIDAIINGKKRIGEGLGLYTYTYGENTGNDFATFESLVRATTSVIEAGDYSFAINIPEQGNFYRLKNNASSWYASSDLRTGETSHKNKLYMKEDGTAASTIWYLTADNKLLSFTKGQYLGDMNSVWAFETVGSEGNVVSFKESAIVGKYQILPSSGRALYGDKVRVDAAPSSNNSGNYAWIIEEVTTLPVTITSAGYATFYCPVAVSLPAEGLKAYYVSETTGSYAKMEEITGVIPANTGVILEGEADTYDLTIGGEAESVTNKLRGTVASEYITDDAYVLSMPTINDEVQPIGFYKATKNQSGNTAFLNNGFKAYLPADGNNARSLVFDFGTETAIESIEGEHGNVKAEIYDLAGRRVQNAQKGLYIVNGKKVIK